VGAKWVGLGEESCKCGRLLNRPASQLGTFVRKCCPSISQKASRARGVNMRQYREGDITAIRMRFSFANGLRQ
jgi:hypothetical protein